MVYIYHLFHIYIYHIYIYHIYHIYHIYIKINNIVIKQSTNFKFLDILIDENRNWKMQINNIKNKLY